MKNTIKNLPAGRTYRALAGKDSFGEFINPLNHGAVGMMKDKKKKKMASGGMTSCKGMGKAVRGGKFKG